MQRREQVRRLVLGLVDAYNAKDLGRVMAAYHPQAAYWSALDDWQRGSDEIRAHVEELFRMLPDEHMTVRALVADDTTAVVEFTARGTSPKPYSLDFTEVFTVEDGRIVEVRVYLDPEEVDAALG